MSRAPSDGEQSGTNLLRNKAELIIAVDHVQGDEIANPPHNNWLGACAEEGDGV